MKLEENRIYPVSQLDVRVATGPLAYAENNRSTIDANWQREVAANATLFDGEFYLAPDYDLQDQRFFARYRRTTFRTLMFWRQDKDMCKPAHIFAVGIIVSREGHMLAARMASWNAGGGRVYFPAGSIDDHDVDAGAVDFIANMQREVGEETGLNLADARPETDYHLVTAAGSYALFKRYYFDLPAAELVRRIETFMAAQAQPELAAIIPVTGPGQLGETSPSYVRAFADWHFNPAK